MLTAPWRCSRAVLWETREERAPRRQTHETAQCEWERLTWPFAASAFPVPRVRFCLVVPL